MKSLDELMKPVMSIISTIFFGVIIGTAYQRFKTYKSNKVNVPHLLEIAKLLFPNTFDEFVSYLNLYLSDKEVFLLKYNYILKYYDPSHLKLLPPLHILYIFSESIKAVYFYDTVNDKNELNPELFIENLLNEKINWATTTTLREMVSIEEQDNREFIIKLFQTIDNDIQLLHKKMLFFDFGFDVFAFTIVDEEIFSKLLELSPDYFHGVESH